jgi:hypothetical protein
MPLLKRTANEVLQDAMQRIRDNTPITNFKPGAIARALVEAMTPEISNIYEYADEVLNIGFLSKTSGEYLDLIGGLFSYPRRTVTVFNPTTGMTTETPIDDDTYRYEISQRVLTAANANYQALRLALLAVPGVSDVIGKEFTHGTGSFSFIIIPEFGFSLDSISSSCDAVLQEIKGYGIRHHVILPTQVPLELSIQLVFQDTATSNEKDKIRLDLKTNLYNYFGNFKMGQGFIYNDLVQQVMDSSEKIVDFTVVKFYLNNVPALLTNQTVDEDAMIVPTYIEVL